MRSLASLFLSKPSPGFIHVEHAALQSPCPPWPVLAFAEPAQEFKHSTRMPLYLIFQFHMSVKYGWRQTYNAGNAVALGIETEIGPGAGQAAAAAGKSLMTGIPGVIPGTPGIPGTTDPGMAGGRQMRNATERRIGAVANSPVLTEEMRRTDILSTIKASLCPLTTSSERASTGKSRT